MKKTEPKKTTPVNSLLIFMTCFGIGFSIVSEFFFDRPRRALLAIMLCLFVVAVASKKREQGEKNQE